MNTTDLATELRALTYSVASLRAETVCSYLTMLLLEPAAPGG